MKRAARFNRRSFIRGRISEGIIGKLLFEMENNGEITRYSKTGRTKDKFCGIDFIIIDLQGKEVPLQVKSSITGAINHRLKFPGIPVVVATRNPVIDKNQVIKIINSYNGQLKGGEDGHRISQYFSKRFWAKGKTGNSTHRDS